MAKLETSVSLFSDKLELKVYGFNHKLPILLSKVLAVAKSFSPTDDRFKVCKVAFASSIILIPGFYHNLFGFPSQLSLCVYIISFIS